MRRLREVARGAAVLVRHGTASELRAFGRAPGECGIPGKVCSAALALFAAAVVGMLLSKFAAMYSAAEVSGEFDPTARREELCALLFFAVFSRRLPEALFKSPVKIRQIFKAHLRGDGEDGGVGGQ